MIYNDFKGIKLSRLGFGTMRLPLIEGGSDGEIDQAAVNEMTRYAIEHGVNYFDTAYPYHASRSELAIGEALKGYPRESFYLATKYPGHQLTAHYDPAAVFEDQLKKCGVEYFDFYLLHNVNENSIKTYLDPKWGMPEYFVRQRELGRIKHLGFSCHGAIDNMREFLDYCGDEMEFCQIQLNYLDWTLQDARGKCALLKERGIPVWVMESVRGGALARLSPENEARLKALRPDESIASWGFRWLQNIPEVKMILSGMSSLEQMEDNVKTFSGGAALTDGETELLYEVADNMKRTVPCTGCRYCCEGCPQGLDIPHLITFANEARIASSINIVMRVEALPEEKRPSACIGCGKCSRTCPQKIDVPSVMRELSDTLAKVPSWEEICRQREEAQNKNKA